MNLQQFIHLFSHLWTFTYFPTFGDYKQFCSEHPDNCLLVPTYKSESVSFFSAWPDASVSPSPMGEGARGWTGDRVGRRDGGADSLTGSEGFVSNSS